MKSLLLVTGSRALSTPAAKEWAVRLLEGTIVPPKSLLPVGARAWDVVLTGGCPSSPDQWAREVAQRAKIPWVEYCINGLRFGSDGKRSVWWKEKPGQTKPHPHERNQAMVDLALKQQKAGWSVRVFGLIAPWSETKGTVVTLQKARAAGLPTTDHHAAENLR